MTLKEIRQSLLSAVNALPCRCKTIFLLCKMRDMKHKEIAARLNISTNTVEGQVHIAINKLKKMLKAHAVA